MIEHTHVWDLANDGLHFFIRSTRELEVNEKYTKCQVQRYYLN